MPVLGRSKAVQQVPLEAVYAVIECKSILNNAALKDVEEKFSKVQMLPRCPSKTKLKKGMQREPAYILFGYQLKTSIQSCLDFMESHEDITVVALNSGCGIWVVERNKPVWLQGTDVEQKIYETLAIFFVSLLEALRGIDLGEPSFIEMLFLGG
jgi:hypothetical protein